MRWKTQRQKKKEMEAQKAKSEVKPAGKSQGGGGVLEKL